MRRDPQTGAIIYTTADHRRFARQRWLRARRQFILGFALGMAALPVSRVVVAGLGAVLVADARAEDEPGRIAAEQTRESQLYAAEVEWASQHGSWLPEAK